MRRYLLPALLVGIPIFTIVLGKAAASAGLSGKATNAQGEVAYWEVISEWYGEGHIYSVKITLPGQAPYGLGESGDVWAYETAVEAASEAKAHLASRGFS